MFRRAIGCALTALAIALAVPAQLLLFAAEYLGDHADEWFAD